MQSAETRMPNRMSPQTMQAIARACNVGASPKEIASDHGITVHAVLAIAKRYNVQRQASIMRARASQPRQVVRKAPAITSPEPIERHGSTYVVERYDYTQPSGSRCQRITLPLLTIQTR